MLPQIGHLFKKEYIISYYVGESLFALVPSLIAMFQGLGEEKGCRNATSLEKVENEITKLIEYSNKTVLEPIPLDPIFGVSTYLRIIFSIRVLSFMAFVLLNVTEFARKEHKENAAAANDSHKPNKEQDKECQKSLMEETSYAKQSDLGNHRSEKVVFYSINFLITFFLYGVLTGLQSYSALPYGNNVFHISINLSTSILLRESFLLIFKF
jgi:hypothetical protein